MDQVSKKQLQEGDKRFGDDMLDRFNLKKGHRVSNGERWYGQGQCHGTDRGHQRFAEVAL